MCKTEVYYDCVREANEDNAEGLVTTSYHEKMSKCSQQS